MKNCYQQHNPNKLTCYAPQQTFGLDVIGIEPAHHPKQPIAFQANPDIIYLPETMNPNQPITLDVQLDPINFPIYQPKLE